MKQQEPYPITLEKEIMQRYPMFDEQVSAMLEAKKDKPWPDWCYLPMAASYAITTKGADVKLAVRYMAQSGLDDFQKISALIPWRYGKPVYRFDDDLVAELTETEASVDDIPVSVLKRLPYPGLFIENPGGINGCIGMFVFLEYDYRYPDTLELRFLYAFDDGSVCPIYFQWSSDKQSLISAMATNIEATARMVAPVRKSLELSSHFDECYDQATRHINLILYLCADECDTSRTSPQPRIRSVKNRPAQASYPDKIAVGTYVGSTIRRNREIHASQAAQNTTPVTGSAKRPHIRRAHWHLYWTGEGRATPRVKWVMPVFVHGDSPQDAVIHPVKK